MVYMQKLTPRKLTNSADESPYKLITSNVAGAVLLSDSDALGSVCENVLKKFSRSVICSCLCVFADCIDELQRSRVGDSSTNRKFITLIKLKLGRCLCGNSDK